MWECWFKIPQKRNSSQPIRIRLKRYSVSVKRLASGLDSEDRIKLCFLYWREMAQLVSWLHLLWQVDTRRTHYWMRDSNLSTSAKPFMIKLQTLLIKPVEKEILQIKLKFSLFIANYHVQFVLKYFFEKSQVCWSWVCVLHSEITLYKVNTHYMHECAGLACSGVWPPVSMADLHSKIWLMFPPPRFIFLQLSANFCQTIDWRTPIWDPPLCLFTVEEEESEHEESFYN